MKASKLIVTTAMTGAAAAGDHSLHYIIVDPTALSVCNVLQTRIAMTKAASLIFSGDALGGNFDRVDRAVEDPKVWKAVNALSESPFDHPTTEVPEDRPHGCEEYQKIVEQAMTIGSQLLGGADAEGRLEEMVINVADLIDEHIKVVNATSIGADMKALRSRYFYQSVATPLAIVVPSCAIPPFEVDQDGEVAAEHRYNWNTILSLRGTEIIQGMASRLLECGGCIEQFMASVTEGTGIDLSFSKGMTQHMPEKLETLARLDFTEVPESLGGVISWLVKKAIAQYGPPTISISAASDRAAGGTVPAAQAIAESIFGLLDGLNAELTSKDGSGPISDAYATLYHQLQC